MRNKKKTVNDFERSSLTYFNEINNFKPLSLNDELSLWEKYRKDNNIDARDKLIKSNLKFVAMVAKSYQGLGLSYADLIAEGNIGLLKSFEKFDPSKGYKTISYAVWWIRQTILEALKQRNLINGDDIDSYRLNDDTFDGLFDNEYKDNEDTKFDNGECSTDVIIENKDNKKMIQNMFKCLSEKELFVIKKYYGFDDDDEMTLESIGEELGLTKERVRQIKEKGLKKMRSIALCEMQNE